MRIICYGLILLFSVLHIPLAQSQHVLSLKEAMKIATDRYGSIKAKAAYAGAARASAIQARKDYLPNLNVAAQQVYGTVNGQNGPLFGLGGLAVSSSGLPLAAQNWNSGFGALYLTNFNWDFFAFGRFKNNIETMESIATREQSDYQQEVFQHQVRVASAYLNLLAAQRLVNSFQKNLMRADTLRDIIVIRALNGLIAGVDSSLANAEVSNAKISLRNMMINEQELSTEFAVLLGDTVHQYTLDTMFIRQIPIAIRQQPELAVSRNHPELMWMKSRVMVSERQIDYFKTLKYPTFSLVGILQTRGSGFASNYAQDQTAFTSNYIQGIKPARGNYLIGVGMIWNFTQILRTQYQVKSQRLITEGLKQEYELFSQKLSAQLELAETKIRYALDNYLEAPVQVKAASDAYLQKSVLYKNGLTNLVDVTQALYALIRAETDRDIAYNNVWQALLLKAAASGDLELFIDEL